MVLAAHLMACPEFAVSGGRPLPEVEPSGLLESLPAEVLEKARELERHVVEVLTGLAPDPPPGAVPRRGFADIDVESAGAQRYPGRVRVLGRCPVSPKAANVRLGLRAATGIRPSGASAGASRQVTAHYLRHCGQYGSP